nr:MAG TPA: hypothetical protein [Caudoviricetes sp.]
MPFFLAPFQLILFCFFQLPILYHKIFICQVLSRFFPPIL